MCSSSLLRDEVYPVCGGPLIPPGRWGLPSVQWAPYPSWEMRFTQCAAGPSSFVGWVSASVHLSPPKRWGLPSVQWPLIPDCAWKMKFTQCAVGSSSLSLERCGSPSVPLISGSAWEMKLTQCAVGPASLIWSLPVCNHPLILPERWGLSSVQPAPHLS